MTNNNPDTPPPNASNSPSQVVIVQQSPSDEDRETTGKFMKWLLGTNKPGQPDPDQPQARNMVLSLSSHNLLIVIALFLLVGGQLTGIIMQASQSTKAPKLQPPAQEVDFASVLSAAAIQNALANAQQAAASAHQDAATAQRAAAATPPPIVERCDPALIPALIAALQRNAPQAPPLIVQVPTQTAGPLPLPPTQTASPEDQHGRTIKPATIDIVPSIDDGKLRPKFPGPLDFSVEYDASETGALTLLNASAFLTIDYRNPGTGGLVGACPTSHGIERAIVNGVGYYESFALTLGWKSTDRPKPREAWENGPLYVTLCTTYQPDNAGAILNRRVYEVDRDPKDQTTILPDPVLNIYVDLQ